MSLTQPQFAPNLYDLIAMFRADRVILLDEDRWSRKGRTHRASITESEWINIPIKTDDKKKAIRKVCIDHDEDWFTPFWNGIHHNFHSAIWFDHFEDELLALFESARSSEKLIDFNLTVFDALLGFLEVDLSYELASSSDFDADAVTEVYQEYQSKNYIHRIENAQAVTINDPQIAHFAERSILHLLFYHGPESFKVLDLLK
ncbi:MAG: WbqC family protein [Balneolaceae bacterium]|nr:WbqC family protein [Balneolaceae bacterium]